MTGVKSDSISEKTTERCFQSRRAPESDGQACGNRAPSALQRNGLHHQRKSPMSRSDTASLYGQIAVWDILFFSYESFLSTVS